MRDTEERVTQLSPLKRALFKLEELQAKLDALERRRREPIAIIGMSCRFPGAENPRAFWRLLRNGVDAITEVPQDRWDVEAFYDPSPGTPGKMNTRWGGFVKGVDLFDPQFFGISPREAAHMDPQQRLLLEGVWEALEDAGYDPYSLAGSNTGVFVGISNNDYSLLQYGDFESIEAYTGTGNAFSVAANRLSYLLDLRGPSFAVDTACSSSLVSTHLACQSLRRGESDLAVAGGVNLMLSPELHITFSMTRLMSPTGRCKTFDADADGYVRGEGCGIIVLKRLADAVRDGDHVLALIHGTAINHDGRSNGLTAPNGLSQQAVIRRALEDAELTPDDLSYVEAHGTGTKLGDPIELRSLGTLLQGRPTGQPCLVGSVKTNIGHLEAAAGIAGVLKVVLALQHEEIPAHLHFRRINPYIPLDQLPLSIATERQPWLSGDGPRYAGVSSFGFGGTNAHTVLGEAPAREPTLHALERPYHILGLSAKNELALRELARRFKNHLVEHPLASLPDLSYTANVGRSHFDHRVALTAANHAALQEQLTEFVSSQEMYHGQVGQSIDRPKVAFLFTGQGSQYPDMGRQLYETQPTFRVVLDQCADILVAHLEQSLLSVIFSDSAAEMALNETAYTQPALFAIEYALAQLWRSWGVEPDYVLGHSVGEYVAACVAGVFSLEDGLMLIAARGRLMQSLPQDGEMAVVFAGQEQLAEALKRYDGKVDMAALNGPSNTVISGERETVRLAVRRLESEGLTVRPLKVSHAFHSLLMEPIQDDFEAVAQDMTYREPSIPFVSNLVGRLLQSGEVPNASYWRRHIRRPVQFHGGMQTLAEEGTHIFLEAGPHPSLLSMGRRCIPEHEALWLPSLRRNEEDWPVLLDSLGALYMAGLDIDWAGFERDYRRLRVQLPTYPFQRERCWIEPSTPEQRQEGVAAHRRAVEKGRQVEREESKEERLVKTEAPRQVEVESPEDSLTAEALLSAEPARRLEMLVSHLRLRLAEVLRLDPARIDLEKPINYLGLDSIMAIELKNKVKRSVGVDVPIASLLQGLNLTQVADQLLVHLTSPVPESRSSLVSGEGITGEYPLSHGQRAMWFQHQVAPGSVFNPVHAVRIRSDLDISLLRGAFQVLVDRHPMLRTTFVSREGEPVQLIHEQGEVDFHQEDASEWSEEDLNERLAEEAHRVFDLERGPLLRVHVFSRSPTEHVLMLAAHHIVVDLWSLAVLISELGILFTSPDGLGSLPPLGLHYPDYVKWQTEMLAGPGGEELWDYWRTKLAGELPVLDLPTDRPRPSVQTHRGASESLWLDVELTKELKEFSESYGVTLYMTLLASFNVLLYRYSGQEDLIIGTPTTGRSRAELMDLVGYFVNPVALRSQLSAGLAFSEFLGQVRQTVVEAVDHQDYPFALLVEKRQPDRDPSRLPISQVMFILQRAHLLYDEGLSKFAVGMDGMRMELAGLALESVNVEQRMAPFDLTLMMAEADEGLAASMTYNTDLFDAATIQRMLGHYRTLLEQVVADPDQRVSAMSLLTDTERRQMLADWNDTTANYPRDRCVHELFEAQVERTPENDAVIFEDERLTYRELNRRANQLSHYLRRIGVGPETVVGISVNRSTEMVVGLLGILKAGGAYLPLDPAYPRERLAFMLDDARVPVLLTQERLVDGLPMSGSQTVRLDADRGPVARESYENPNDVVTPENLAYVIYTSGSTGRPKGVSLQHGGLANLVAAQTEAFGVEAGSRVLQFASLSFDASVSETFMALLTGATLCLARQDVLASVSGLRQLLHDHAITTVTLPPSLLSVLPSEGLPSLRTVISAGEACSPDIVARWSPGRRFFNAYGPTEATIGPTLHPVDYVIDGVNNVPIGRPIPNIQVYVLDRCLQMVPIGVPGELYIGGVGLARGYLNRPGLTAQKFIAHPLSDDPGARLYGTGDLARYRSDGTIEFLGRIDHQVKVRGFRIELGEIEAVLERHPALQRAFVLAREGELGDERLVAYVVPGDYPKPTVPELRGFLGAKLPRYMIPSSFVTMEALPLTPSGKVDRKALPVPESTRPDLGTAYAMPQTGMERKLAAVWQQVLGVEKVGTHDNFFDLGGHSLMLAKVHSRLEETVGRELSMVELFKYPTVAALAEYLTEQPQDRLPSQRSQERAERQRAAIMRQRRLRQGISRGR
jgi:amino acid adenylation domain-containing protein